MHTQPLSPRSSLMVAVGSQGGTGLKHSFLGAAVPFYQSVAVRMSNTFTSFQGSCMHHTSQCECQSPVLCNREAWMSLPGVACCCQSSPPRTEGDVFHRRLFCSKFSVTAMTESSHKSHQLSLLLTRAL